MLIFLQITLMRYSISIAFILLFFISCQTTEKKTDKHSNELIEKFKPFLNGTWVPVDYIKAIVKTKSPLKSSEEITFISEFSIDTTGIIKDSIHVLAAMGNHEGYDFYVYFKQGITSTSLLTDINGYSEELSSSYELGYVISKSDTSLILSHYDKNKKLLDETKYIKAPVNESNNEEDASGLQYMVNKKLVSGTYIVTDSTGGETQVELTNEGKIMGFPGFKTYYVITDFVADPENTTDKM